MNVQAQRGVGLMEVMVAALILAVAVLGFIALQYRSLEAANEAYYRTQAMSVARDLAERIRANQFAQASYVSELAYSKSTTATDSSHSATTHECLGSTKNCTQSQFALADAREIKAKAQAAGMQVAMEKCSGVARYCIYIAWEDTQPKEGTAADKSCTNSGTYIDGSRCIVMEAYQ